MAHPRTVYIADRSLVRTEPPRLESYGPRPYYPEVLPISNSGLLKSSKMDMLRLFRLLGW